MPWQISGTWSQWRPQALKRRLRELLGLEVQAFRTLDLLVGMCCFAWPESTLVIFGDIFVETGDKKFRMYPWQL